MDKNQVIISYMLNCPVIHDNPLFFNAIQAQDENKEIITIANDRVMNTRYIDGSVMKRYSFTIVDFRSISFNPVPIIDETTTTEPEYKAENVEDMFDVQGIIDWIEEQRDSGNYPDFGDDCVIDDMVTTSDIPNLNGVDANVSPALAKYSITIQIDYIDNSKKCFK